MQTMQRPTANYGHLVIDGRQGVSLHRHPSLKRLPHAENERTNVVLGQATELNQSGHATTREATVKKSELVMSIIDLFITSHAVTHNRHSKKAL